jgi:hypothetical protein
MRSQAPVDADEEHPQGSCRIAGNLLMMPLCVIMGYLVSIIKLHSGASSALYCSTARSDLTVGLDEIHKLPIDDFRSR